MAKLSNFTPDEQLLIILIINIEALMNKVVELIDMDYDDLQKSLGLATGDYIRGLSDIELRKLPKAHRAQSLQAEALANKYKRGNSN